MTDSPADNSPPGTRPEISLQLRDQQTWVITVSLAILAVLALAFMLVYTRTVLIPFVVALFIGSMASPLMDVLELKYRMSHGASVIISLLFVCVISVIFGLVLLTCIQKVVDESDRMSRDFEALFDNISRMIPWNDDDGPIANNDQAIEDRGSFNENELIDEIDTQETADSSIDVPGPVGPQVSSQEHSRGRMREFLSSQAMVFATSLAGTAINFMSSGMLTLIFAMFVLAGRRPHVVRTGVYAEIDSQIRNYIGTKVALSMGTGILVWMVLRIMQMPLADVFGMLAFLLNFIPSVGSIIATAIPIPFALTMLPAGAGTLSYVWLIGVILIPGAIQMLVGNVLEPKLMGDGLQLHPITVLLALAIWGLLWGTVGMLLAVPMTAIIRIVLLRFDITRPAAQVLAGELPDLRGLRATT